MSPELGTYAILAVIGGLWFEIRTLRVEVRVMRDALIRKGIIDGKAA